MALTPPASAGLLHLGDLTVDPPVILAPMAGVTTAAFRQLCRSFGAGLYVNEMITARALVERNPRTLRMLTPAPGESPRSVQLYGVDPEVVVLAVKILTVELGVDHIDLNFGCPAPKVTRKGGGAALPAHPVLFDNLVSSAVAAAGGRPVTVKLRMGIDRHLPTAPRAARIAEQAGAAAVTLHARTARQLYSGQADWEAIARLKAEITTIPVIGNGDIWSAGDALDMIRTTGCDGVMVGRGCLGRPWLFAELAEVLAGRSAPPPPKLGQVAEIMKTHVRLLGEQFGIERAVRDFRKHTGWYMTGFPVGPAKRRELSTVADLAALDAALDDLDPELELPEASRALPRGHSAGPRQVTLPEGWLDNADDPTPPMGADALVSGG